MEKPPPPPPVASAVAPTPSSLLPYAVTAISVVVLVAVAALLFAQPRRARMAIDKVIVLDGPASAPSAPAAPVAAEQPPSMAHAAVPAADAPEPAPGDVLEALLTDEGSSGDGSVKIGGITVYVSGGHRGERVRFRILDVKTSRKGNRYAKAELVSAAAGAPQEETAP